VVGIVKRNVEPFPARIRSTSYRRLALCSLADCQTHAGTRILRVGVRALKDAKYLLLKFGVYADAVISTEAPLPKPSCINFFDWRRADSWVARGRQVLVIE